MWSLHFSHVQYWFRNKPRFYGIIVHITLQKGPYWPLNGAWLTPEWCLTNPWMIPDWSLNGVWLIPEWCLTNPWMIPEWCLNDPGMVSDWSLNGAWLILEWCLTDPWMVPDWPLNGAWLIPEWCLNDPWLMNDPWMLPNWSLSGAWHIWKVPDWSLNVKNILIWGIDMMFKCFFIIPCYGNIITECPHLYICLLGLSLSALLDMGHVSDVTRVEWQSDSGATKYVKNVPSSGCHPSLVLMLIATVNG